MQSRMNPEHSTVLIHRCEGLRKISMFAIRKEGAIAQLARVLAWHARSQGFESP